MGQAKQRGTFEERKAKAITDGRKKARMEPPIQQVRREGYGKGFGALAALYTMAAMGGYGQWGRRK